MMKLIAVLQNVPDRRGMATPFRLGRKLGKRQRHALGIMRGTTPCHATLTETLRAIDPHALAAVLGAVDDAGSADRSGGFAFPIKDNQKNLRENIVTAFNEPVFFLWALT